MLVFGLFIILGIIAAAFGSLLGLGGGIIIVPELIYLSPTLFDGNMLASTAVGTSMVVLSFTAFGSSLTYIKAKKLISKAHGFSWYPFYLLPWILSGLNSRLTEY
jgi:uncharacterized protein